jgi:hypothetical protein
VDIGLGETLGGLNVHKCDSVFLPLLASHQGLKTQEESLKVTENMSAIQEQGLNVPMLGRARTGMCVFVKPTREAEGA